MATYVMVQQEVRRATKQTVKTCWIAHVKELNGLAPRRASNRTAADRRTNPCPPDKRAIIEAAMRRLGVLPSSKRFEPTPARP